MKRIKEPKDLHDQFGPWMQCGPDGVPFYLECPLYSDIKLRDIPKALSHIARFGGHTKFHYSVAQHSVLVSYLAPKQYALEALLHDAAEAYTGDIVTQIKNLVPEMADWVARVEMAVANELSRELGVGIPTKSRPEVKHADLRALATEKRDVMVKSMWSWGKLPRPAQTQIHPMSPEAAELDFRIRFYQLTGKEIA